MLLKGLREPGKNEHDQGIIRGMIKSLIKITSQGQWPLEKGGEHLRILIGHLELWKDV